MTESPPQSNAGAPAAKPTRVPVFVSSNRLEAAIVIEGGFDPADITADLLMASLSSSGIAAAAIDRKAVEALASVYATQPDQKLQGVVARGQPPEHGTDGKFELTAGRVQDDAPPEACRLPVVAPGDAIGRINQATSGTTGWDVRGGPLPARSGRPVVIGAGPGVELDPAGNATATEAGVVKLDHGSLRIDTVLTVPGDAGPQTGHIDFAGSVAIGGNVVDGCSLRAERDLLVKGDIRAANVYAGRHAKLVGGMAAGNDGSLHVSGKLRALYLHQVTGTIGENAVIDHQLSDCDLTVGFDLDARGATVSGGIVRVGRHAAIDVLGSGDESPTRVVIGSLGKLESLLDELHAMTPDLQADHDAKRAAIHEVEKQGQPQAEITELREAFQAVDDLLPRIEAGLGRVDAIRDKQRSAKLWVTGRVLPGAVVDFGQTAVRFTEPVAGPFGLRLNGSEPVLEFPADHDTVDLADVAEVIDGSTELAKESARAA